MEIIAQRVFSPLYIILDTLFLVFFCVLLLIKKRYLTLLFGIAGGILYMIVDYGIFHLMLGTRSIQNGNMFGVLLWMSMSYGITNFALIWIWLSKDKYFKEFTAAIWIWWICCPMISNTFAFGENIKIQRTTGSYHGFMAIIMLVSYFALIVYNVFQKEKNYKFNILWLFSLGILVQLGWELGLLIGGIRSAELGAYEKLMTLVTNSLVETNLGLPAIYLIYLTVSRRFTENLRVNQPLTFYANLEHNNLLKYNFRTK